MSAFCAYATKKTERIKQSFFSFVTTIFMLIALAQHEEMTSESWSNPRTKAIHSCGVEYEQYPYKPFLKWLNYMQKILEHTARSQWTSIYPKHSWLDWLWRWMASLLFGWLIRIGHQKIWRDDWKWCLHLGSKNNIFQIYIYQDKQNPFISMSDWFHHASKFSKSKSDI